MPPMGEFSPPKARKNGKQAKKILQKALAGNAPEDAHAGDVATAFVAKGNGNVANETSRNADELDEGDREYLPQNEGGKRKNRKSKRARNQQRANNELKAKKEDEGASNVPGVAKAMTKVVPRAANPTMAAPSATETITATSEATSLA
jgi:hypothetical protein